MKSLLELLILVLLCYILCGYSSDDKRYENGFCELNADYVTFVFKHNDNIYEISYTNRDFEGKQVLAAFHLGVNPWRFSDGYPRIKCPKEMTTSHGKIITKARLLGIRDIWLKLLEEQIKKDNFSYFNQ